MISCSAKTKPFGRCSVRETCPPFRPFSRPSVDPLLHRASVDPLLHRASTRRSAGRGLYRTDLGTGAGGYVINIIFALSADGGLQNSSVHLYNHDVSTTRVDPVTLTEPLLPSIRKSCQIRWKARRGGGGGKKVRRRGSLEWGSWGQAEQRAGAWWEEDLFICVKYFLYHYCYLSPLPWW